MKKLFVFVNCCKVELESSDLTGAALLSAAGFEIPSRFTAELQLQVLPGEGHHYSK